MFCIDVYLASYPAGMAYDLATMSLIFLALWAAAAAFLVWNAKPAAVLPLVKSPVGFMPPPLG